MDHMLRIALAFLKALAVITAVGLTATLVRGAGEWPATPPQAPLLIPNQPDYNALATDEYNRQVQDFREQMMEDLEEMKDKQEENESWQKPVF